MTKKKKKSMYRKKKIPSSLRQMVWITYNGEIFRSKCQVDWCKNTVTPFTFEVGHNKPESKGGKTTLENLLPICGCCNRSMGNKYTITEYCEKFSQLRNSKVLQSHTSVTPSLLHRFIRPFQCFRF